MRFCAYCGAPVVPAGKFCVECGRQLDRAAGGRIRGLQLTAAFVGVFLGILIVGLVAVYLIVPDKRGAKIALTMPSPPTEDSGAQSDQKLPPGHPKIELPAKARQFIEQVESDAHAHPNDLAAWNKFGDVALRAAMLDPSYYPKAEQAYGHSLKLNPDSPDALRGIGNLDYDHKDYDQAIAAYEHYLKQQPGDPEVRTDLGTMYLYTGNPDQAIVQYKRALKVKPDFFEAHYNMGIAYGERNDNDDARRAFQQALELAPNNAARSKVQEVMSKLPGGAGARVASAGSKGSPPAGPSASDVASADSSSIPSQDAAADKSEALSFHSQIEEIVRAIPFAGPKVASVQWPEPYKATVLMDNFPMDQMPPFAKQKFLTDLKDGIKVAKSTHNINSPVEVDITDRGSGAVMESVSQ